jgi:hypothetical protein
MESMARKRETHCNIVGWRETVAGAVVVAIILTSAYLVGSQMAEWYAEMAQKIVGGGG